MPLKSHLISYKERFLSTQKGDCIHYITRKLMIESNFHFINKVIGAKTGVTRVPHYSHAWSFDHCAPAIIIEISPI